MSGSGSGCEQRVCLIKWCLGQAAGEWTGVRLQPQPSPHGPTRASLGFLAAWLPPGTPTAWVVIEGLVDSIPVTPAESFMAFLPNPGSPAASLLPLSLSYMRVTHWTDLRGEDMDPTFQGERQDQSVEEQVA